MPAKFEYSVVTTPSGREIAFRRGGAGPPAVLCHESPRSSVALLALAERLADRFTVYAMDNPGFGLSDPLPLPRPDAADFADALRETFDAIGLGRAPVYGTHTGAVIAMEFARRHPNRAVSATLDGYPVFTAQEQEEALASYLVPIPPDWEGTYLAWLWARVRDQFAFFPWYRRGQSARLPRPAPPLALHQQVVADLLSAGDHYRAAYASAFRYVAAAPVGDVSVPVTYLARSDDLLFGHLDRLPHLPANGAIVRLTPDRDAWGRAIGEALGRAKGDLAPPPPRFGCPRPAAGRIARGFLQAPQGALMARFAGAGDGDPIVLLHASPGSSRNHEDLIRHLACERTVIAIDLPGHGGSAPTPEGATLDAIGAWLLAAIDFAGVRGFDIAALQTSASIAATLSAQAGERAKHVAIVDPLPDDAETRGTFREKLVDIAPQWHGGHLLAAWHTLRDGELWKPWFDRRPDVARNCGIDPDTARLDGTMTEWMRGGPSYAFAIRAALASPLAPRLASLPRKTIVALAGDPWSGAARRTAEVAMSGFSEVADAAEPVARSIASACGACRR